MNFRAFHFLQFQSSASVLGTFPAREGCEESRRSAIKKARPCIGTGLEYSRGTTLLAPTESEPLLQDTIMPRRC